MNKTKKIGKFYEKKSRKTFLKNAAMSYLK